jgi:hypothetical protein
MLTLAARAHIRAACRYRLFNFQSESVQVLGRLGEHLPLPISDKSAQQKTLGRVGADFIQVGLNVLHGTFVSLELAPTCEHEPEDCGSFVKRMTSHSGPIAGGWLASIRVNFEP